MAVPAPPGPAPVRRCPSRSPERGTDSGRLGPRPGRPRRRRRVAPQHAARRCAARGAAVAACADEAADEALVVAAGGVPLVVACDSLALATPDRRGCRRGQGRRGRSPRYADRQESRREQRFIWVKRHACRSRSVTSPSRAVRERSGASIVTTTLPRTCPSSTRASASPVRANGSLVRTQGSRSPLATSAARASSTAVLRSRGTSPPPSSATSGLSATEASRAGSTRGATARRASPPTRSNTPSTPSGATARTRSATPSPPVTGTAPSSVSRSRLPALAVPITRSPRARASWTVGMPTPPPAPLTSSVAPGGSARVVSAS